MRILLIGPTAVGKTALSVDLAQGLDAEIISADSRQCYKFMNIGTATPSDEERDDVRHYNLSIIDPAEKDNAMNFRERAMQWEDEIQSRGKNVLYVGGSTLHLQCIIQPLDDVPNANEENISQLEAQIEKESIEALYQKLQDVDPDYIPKMDGMNRQRIIRALDVWMQTGRPFSSFHSGDEIRLPDDMIIFGLKRDRQTLYDRINLRVDTMFDEGFLDEVRSLLDRGYSLDDPGLNTVGYKQAIAFLQGDLTREKMVADMKTQTRRYAKRQLSWFRRWDFIHWVDLDEKTPEQARDFICQKVAAELNKE
ncbi:MAG TPA: tRNA (adenosine(37)-N6)-dimethylallyltransferase MiaA [Balneolaceae bacterium]|nr:tRNA (adenosine(37)-N6)-dimethylallyltransferase MiaA [Balneolaceae bacterium]